MWRVSCPLGLRAEGALSSYEHGSAQLKCAVSVTSVVVLGELRYVFREG